MFVTGAVDLPFFSGMTFLIAVPTGVKFFNWIGTMWGGSLSFDTPMLWSIGFLATFLFGGLTGIILAVPPLDFHVSDSYFVVAHFHYVVFGTVVFAMFAGFYFWWPKMTGRMLDERLGKVHFWLLFVGFHTTFLVQHWLGVEGMPRRYADYLPDDGFTTLNQVSTIGAFLLGASTLPFLYNVYDLAQGRRWSSVDDPWGWGRSLEWATVLPAAAAQLRHASRGSAPSRRPSTCTTRRSPRTGRRRPTPCPRRSAAPSAGDSPVKVESLIFGAMALFFAIVATVYGLLSHEVVGTTALVLVRRPGPGHRLLHVPAVRHASGRGPRTGQTGRSPTRPASSASTARTAGGRCRRPGPPRSCASGSPSAGG